MRILDLKLKQNNAAIYNEQVALLYAALPLSILASLINGSILVYVQRSVIDHAVLIIWLTSLILFITLRGAIYLSYKHSKFWPKSDKRWGNINTLSVILLSAIWGSTSIFLFSAQSVSHQAFLGFVIAGMSAGAISTLSFSRHTVLIFLTCVLLPLASRFIMLDTEFGIAMGSMILLYYFIIVSLSLKNYNNTYQNIELRYCAEEQQKALKQSEEKYYNIFDSAPLGILHYTSEGKITSKNKMFVDLVEMRNDSLLKLNLLTDVQDLDFTNAIRNSLKGRLGQYKGSTIVISSYTDKPIRMYCRATHGANGEISGGVAILEDISEDSRIEQLKNEFISTVSHELRTPLTAIFGSVELLKNAKSQVTESQFDSLIDIVSRNSERLLHLVNDILDIEKISTGKMEFHFEDLDLSEIIKQSVVDNQSYAEKHQVEYVVNEIPEYITVTVDKIRFQQVMANLLSNAAKFSPENSKISVGIIEKNNLVRVYVKDNGPGIPAEFQNKIFEKFTQNDASDTRQSGGTGLGLAISKEIVERMRGQLNFETEQGKGSVFYFELPVVTEHLNKVSSER